MWTYVLFITSALTVIVAEITAPGIDRTISDGVKSDGYKIVYGDEDMVIINEVVNDMEKNVLKNKINLNSMLPPLPPEDVKCLMSVDRYCSKDMVQIKGVIIEAVRNDCQNCTVKQKEEAGRVIASMMAHDPAAWKLFLTRSALQNMPEKKLTQPEETRFKDVGEPEEVISSKNRYTYPGVKVRVRRYAAEKV